MLKAKDKYKLTYFDIYGRGQYVRIAFELFKCEWEDDRHPFRDETWLKA